MAKASGERQNSGKITVLSVGSVEQDYRELSEIISSSEWPLCPEVEWRLKSSPSVPAALADLAQDQIHIVLCESDLGTESWKELWARLAAQPDPPFLIVTSRLADEYLWAEALNLGAYDVLAKPFDPVEVVRTLSQAGLHRRHRHPQRKLNAIGYPQTDFDAQRSGAALAETTAGPKTASRLR